VSLRPRRALLGLITAVAALAVLPAAASASISPTLTLTQSSGTTAGSNPATVGFDAAFNPSAGDSVKDVTFALAPGLLANADINGGACLLAASPTAACQVGTGTVTAGGAPVAVTEYLVVAPSGSGGAAGVEVVNNATQTPVTTGVATVTATGLDVAFTNLPAALDISEMNITLTDLRLPTSCPAKPANVTVTADSQNAASTPTTASAPLNVTGCSGLPYAPQLTAAVAATKSGGAALTLGITQAANESANSNIVLHLGGSITPNAGADIPCLTGTGCTIGTATATSPLLPSVVLANGTVKLGGSATTPTITISWGAPFPLTINGTVSLSTNSVTFANVPDLPLTSLQLKITGPNGQSAFMTNCAPSSLVGNFTAQGTQTATSTAPITFTGCVVKPSVSGSTSGLASGHPSVKFKVAHGKNGPNVSSVSIGLPTGLKFSHSAFVTKKTCVTKGGTKKCTSTTLIKGLSVKGGTAKSVALKGGKLVITLKKASASVSITASGPLVTETKALQTNVKKHKTKTLKFALKVTDAAHNTTSTTLSLKAH
jgi:hypothetical protein